MIETEECSNSSLLGKLQRTSWTDSMVFFGSSKTTWHVKGPFWILGKGIRNFLVVLGPFPVCWLLPSIKSSLFARVLLHCGLIWACVLISVPVHYSLNLRLAMGLIHQHICSTLSSECLGYLTAKAREPSAARDLLLTKTLRFSREGIWQSVPGWDSGGWQEQAVKWVWLEDAWSLS